MIAEAVESCLAQDYENIEIVISDDGSSDGTAEILLDYQKKYPKKIKLILNEVNQGIVKNSNVALANCSGDLIAFTAGDDVLYSNKVRLQVKAFEQNPNLVFCYHPCHILQGSVVTETVGHRDKDLVKNFYEMISKYGAQIPGPVPMVASRALPVGGFNEAIPTACDWLLFIEVCSKGEVVRLDKVLSQYRKHAGNIGNKIFFYADDFLKTLTYIEEKYYKDDRVSHACAKGRSRFLLGVIYNALISGNSDAFKKYSDIYREHDGRFATAIGLLDKVPGIRVALTAFRNVLKKAI